MTAKKKVFSFPNLSASIVKYLREDQQYSLYQIGKLFQLDESFISRVARGQNDFTCEHLERLEKTLGEPIPHLLLKIIPGHSISERGKDFHNYFLELRNKMDEIEKKLREFRKDNQREK